MQSLVQRFRKAYAEHRRREGHAEDIPLHEFPYIRSGPLQKMWSVRARSFDVAMRAVLQPFEESTRRPLTVLDLGAGNGWFSYHLARRGHRAIAIDLRSDDVDGLGVMRNNDPRARIFHALVADFVYLPVATHQADLCVFNASFHYATSVTDILNESVRVTRPGGRIVIIDTPFYHTRDAGEQMVSEKLRNAEVVFGDLTEDLTAIPFIEFLTPTQLTVASEPLGLAWTRHRVRYPLWYEARPLVAWVRRERTPSRFDVWEGVVPD